MARCDHVASGGRVRCGGAAVSGCTASTPGRSGAPCWTCRARRRGLTRPGGQASARGPCSRAVLCVLPRTGWARGRWGRRAAGWRPWRGRRWRRRGGRRGGQVCAAGGHSGYARCAKPCRGAPSFAWKGQGGAAGAGGMVSARHVTGLSVPLIVQPQSERVVSAGTSARKNSWPLCLHARGPHAGHTQTRAHASQCVTVEHASTGICVHHARVSWISKQPGVICPS